MKINSQIIFLSNSSISLTPKEQNIIIQGKIYENINIKNESKQFSFNYYKDGKLENISNCKMSSDKNLYKISWIAHKRIKTNFFGAHVDVTDIIDVDERYEEILKEYSEFLDQFSTDSIYSAFGFHEKLLYSDITFSLRFLSVQKSSSFMTFSFNCWTLSSTSKRPP